MKILKVEGCIDKDWNMSVATIVRAGKGVAVQKHEGIFIAYCDPDYKFINRKLKDRHHGFKYIDGRMMDKVEFYPMQWKEWLEILKNEHLIESDVKQEWRFLMANSVEFDHDHTIMYLDIETKDCLDTENTPEPILSVVMLLNGKYMKLIWHPTFVSPSPDVVVFKTEKQMLNALVSYMAREVPTIFAGWNVNFDMAYIINRCKLLEVDYKIISCMNEVFVRKSGAAVVKGHEVFDMLEAVKKITFNRLRSYSLKNISKKFLTAEKISRWPSTGKMWEEAPEFLLEYNSRDVELLPMLDKEFGIFDFFFAMQDLVGLPLFELYHNSMIIDFSILKAFKDEFVFPDVPFTTRAEYEGAKVLDPATGRFRNVAVMDFKSLYPSIIMSYNISPENIREDGEINVDGVRFARSPTGIFPRLIAGFWDERFRIKKKLRDDSTLTEQARSALHNRQIAIKTVMNSFYGVTAFPGFRLYDYRVAESITFLGRQLLNRAKSLAESKGYRVLSGDTDSTFIAIDEKGLDEAVKASDSLVGHMNSVLAKELKLETGIEPKVEMEFEKMFESIIFIGLKKKYAGLVGYKDGKFLVGKDGKRAPKLSVTGFEIIRKDTPPLAKKILVEAFTKMLNFESMQSIERWLQSEIAALKIEINDDCCLNLEMTRLYSEYNSLPMHARASLYSTENLGIQFLPGDKVNVMYVKSVPKGMPYTDVVAYKDDPTKLKGFKVDKAVWIEKSIIKKLKPTFDALGGDDFNFDAAQTKLGSW